MLEQSVHFNPDERDYLRQNKRRGLIGLVMKLSGGRIQTETGANYVLLVFVVIVLTAAFLIFFSSR